MHTGVPQGNHLHSHATHVLLETLEEAVGVAFELRVPTLLDDVSVTTVYDDMLPAFGPEFVHLSSLPIERGGRVTVRCLPEDRFLVTIETDPVGDGMATAVVQGYDRVALVRTLGFAVQATEERLTTQRLASDVESYSEQLSLCLEETVWLRELTSQTEYCDATRGVTAMAARILPGLQFVVGAESLVFVRQHHGGDDQHDESFIACCTGKALPMPFCTNVIEAWGAEARYDTVLVNPRDSRPQAFEEGNLRSLVLVPVQHETENIGWLLAVNRIPRPDIRDDEEFGTVEASMLQSASVFLATHTRTENLFQENEELLVGLILTLARSLEARDPYTLGHSDRVASVARLLSDELGLSEAEAHRIHLCGLLHDIGKIGIPDETLNKSETLTAQDIERIQRHPEMGVSILSGISSLRYLLPGVLHHHERIDGAGYPHGLSGDSIPMDARILAVADSFDAMTSDRPYRAGMPVEKAVSILRKGAGTQWDAEVVKAFLEVESQICEISGTCRSADASVHGCLADVGTDQSRVTRPAGTLQHAQTLPDVFWQSQ